MGRIEVDEDVCKGCLICVSVCPKQVIAAAERTNRFGYRPVRMEPGGSCTGCAACALMCPDVAISVYR